MEMVKMDLIRRRFSTAVLALALTIVVHLSDTILAWDEAPVKFIGVSGTKQFFLVNSSAAMDFPMAQSLCSVAWQLQPASIESADEFRVLDQFFTRSNEAVDLNAWTSGSSGFGAGCGNLWLTGSPIMFNVEKPWPENAGISPTYSWYKCVSIRRSCAFTTYPNACELKTRLIFSDCKDRKPYICQRMM